MSTALPMMVVSAVASAGSASASVGQAATHSGTPSFSSAQKSHQPSLKFVVGVRTETMPSSMWAGRSAPRGQASTQRSQRMHDATSRLSSWPPGGRTWASAGTSFKPPMARSTPAPPTPKAKVRRDMPAPSRFFSSPMSSPLLRGPARRTRSARTLVLREQLFQHLAVGL